MPIPNTPLPTTVTTAQAIALQKFNLTINNEEKVKLLNNWLRVNALPTIPDYNETKAKSNRDRYLDGLNPKDLVGVILD